MTVDQQESQYLLMREAESLRMASQAMEPETATIHRRMAAAYADRANAIILPEGDRA